MEFLSCLLLRNETMFSVVGYQFFSGVFVTPSPFSRLSSAVLAWRAFDSGLLSQLYLECLQSLSASQESGAYASYFCLVTILLLLIVLFCRLFTHRQNDLQTQHKEQIQTNSACADRITCDSAQRLDQGMENHRALPFTISDQENEEGS